MADKIVQKLMTQILLRNDSATNWSTVNPILSKGEIGIELDTGMFKIGDGTTNWNTLSYAHKTLIDTGLFKYDENDKLTLNVPDSQAIGSTLKVQQDGTLAWEAPSSITVEGLQSSVESLNEAVFGTKEGTIAATGLTSRIAALEDVVGDAEEGLVKDVADAAGQAADNAAAIEVLKGDANTAGSVAKAVADAKSELEGKINAKADASALDNYVTTAVYNAHLTTQQEADKAQNDRLDAVEKTASDNKAAIEALDKVVNGEDGASGLAKDVADLKTAVGEGSALDTRLDTVEGKVSTLEGTVGTLSGEGVGSVKEAKDAADAAQGTADDAKAKAETAQSGVDALAEELYGKTDGVLNTTSRIDTLEEKIADLEEFDHSTYATKEELKAVSDVVDVLNGEATVAGSVKEAKKVADDAAAQAGTNAQAIAKLNGSDTEEGSIAKAIKDSQDAQDLVIAGKASQGDLDAVAGRVTVVENVLNDTVTGEGETAVTVPGLKSRVTAVEGVASDNAAAIQSLQNAVAGGMERVIVDALPAVSDAKKNVIYMVKDTSSAENQNVYQEYVVVKVINEDNSETLHWEELGDTHIDLTDYATKDYVDTALTNYHTKEEANNAFAGKQAFEDHVAEVRTELGTKPTVEEGQTAPTVWGELADLEANKLDAADQVVKSVSEDFTLTAEGQLSINRTKVFVLDGGNAAGWPSPEEA